MKKKAKKKMYNGRVSTTGHPLAWLNVNRLQD